MSKPISNTSVPHYATLFTPQKGPLVEIRIGIMNSPREIGFESSQSSTEVEETIRTAFDEKATHLRLADEKGTLYLVPREGVAYVQIGNEESRRVGFVS